jgi:hypothetical protein
MRHAVQKMRREYTCLTYLAQDLGVKLGYHR